MNRILIIISLLLMSGYALTQEPIWMHPNRGQWDDRIEYKVDLQMGEMLIEKDGFTYFLNDAQQSLGHNHQEDYHDHEHEQDEYHSHVIKQKFSGSTWDDVREELNPSSFYRNYILGNEKSKWKSNIHGYSLIKMKSLYQGIDLELNGSNGQLKYSLSVQPGIDASQISMVYEGQDGLFLDEKGNLHIKNRFGEIIEEKPIAWINKDGKRSAVEINFEINNETVVFSFPKGYNDAYELIIDPNLTFASFSGSTADNWGFTAAPDSNGNLFGGSIAFNLGYPITVGAFDTTFNNAFGGGITDIAISKFTSDGTALIYSTYLGGVGAETPNSIVSAPNGELYIFGITSSANFPMAGTPYDNVYDGGPAPSGPTNGITFSGGSDLYVARLNAAGSALLSSTFVGGTGIDGLNTTALQFNYGDQFRGEIILDDNGDVYVSSTTQSLDFPTLQGAQGALNGSQDAVLFKMQPDLSAMIWSTYFGGSALETGNSVQIAQNGDVYMAGGTSSGNMPFVGGEDPTFNGGIDGYLARFNGNTGASLSGTYMGSGEYDQTYFVQLDVDDEVYVYGQSEADLGVTAPYGVPNSGQFIWKYNHNLNTVFWKTMIGAGSGHVELSPTAFLVSDCYDIYLSGWGGSINANATVSQAVNSSTIGFPTTADAFQSATNGNNFYIAVLGQDASILKYASYMGGITNSPNHVDGGTSRFDKSGRIYHAVCGACGGDPNGFTSTPGAWSPNNQSSNCNMAVFKFELSTIEALVTDPDPVVCLPDPVIFSNNSANGNDFFWDFGDNTTSSDVNPTHLYPGPGNYTVTLIVSDTNGCFSPDSVQFEVVIGDFNGGAIQPPGPICPGDSYQLEAYGGVDFDWSPGVFLDDSTSATPIATVFNTTDFMVIISDSCGIDTAYVTLPVFIGSATVSNDTSICLGNTVDLFATGGGSYVWSPPTYLDDPNSETPTSEPLNDITYNVEITTPTGCILNETVTIDVYFTPPVPVMPDTIPLCEGASAQVVASGGVSYLWYPDQDINTLTNDTVIVNPSNDLFYYCDLTNACGTVTDSVYVDVVISTITAGNDSIICPGESVPLWATGGVSYNWWPANTLNDNNASLVYATPSQPTTYYVLGVDENGCSGIDSVEIDLYPLAFIDAGSDAYAFFGDNVQLNATSTTVGPFIWSPVEYLSCVVCTDPIANPDQNFTYTVSYTDANGCKASDTVNIFYDPIIYVPNTFTPNTDDPYNMVFLAEGGNINDFEMLIFNRWGELIFESNNIQEGWDGTYKDIPCQDGTYVWKINLTDFEDNEYNYVGHVNLLR